jgi:CheY-like chemotaxis protein
VGKNHHTILVAEDDPNMQILYHDEFEGEGFQVERVGNGLEVLFYLESGKADLIITDTKMPLMNGLEMITQVRQKYPNLPIIVISGNYKREDFEAGGYDIQAFFSKPADLKEVKKKINEVLGINKTPN